MSQTTLLQQLRQEENPDIARDLALQLLGLSQKREMVDAALRTLANADLTDGARPVLRQKAVFYFENDSRDNGALIREQLVRMLADLGHPDERDLYLRGVDTYEIEPFMGEVTQNLRAVSLVGLAINDPDLAHLYATKLLSEIESTSPFNGEPAVTAINLLSQHDHPLPIYEFLLLGGMEAIDAGQNEVVGKALESLGSRFPIDLYRTLIDQFAERDRAVVSMGMVTHIVEHRIEALYDKLEDILTYTRHDELHNYGAVMMATSHDNTLIERLYGLAKLSSQHRLTNYIEAIELIPGEEKEELLESLRKRADNT